MLFRRGIVRWWNVAFSGSRAAKVDEDADHDQQQRPGIAKVQSSKVIQQKEDSQGDQYRCPEQASGPASGAGTQLVSDVDTHSGSLRPSHRAFVPDPYTKADQQHWQEVPDVKYAVIIEEEKHTERYENDRANHV